MYKKHNKGFTLIELLVVIAVIAILAVLIIIRIGSSAADARDARRKSDLAQVRTAIESYLAKAGDVDNTVTAEDLTKANIEETALDCFIDTDDSDGHKPSYYLAGGDYPEDPSSTTATRVYYEYTCNTTDDMWTVTATLDDGSTTFSVSH